MGSLQLKMCKALSDVMARLGLEAYPRESVKSKDRYIEKDMDKLVGE